tara:strand:+ start:107 stop:742 length:636 start_codon:yes stop_codon:yes gene_type:complete
MAGLAVENLSVFTSDIAAAMKEVDSRSPRAANARTGVQYQPGIGPHPETQTVKLVVEELQRLFPKRYEGRLALGVPYPHESRQKCDVCIGLEPGWEWAIEVKMLRRMGDNGKPNDNILMHILSPYQQDRSALTDCSKLLNSEFHGRKAVVIYGYDYPDFPMDPAIEAFEVLAGRTVRLGERCASSYKELIHPVHQSGRVFAWEVFENRKVC